MPRPIKVISNKSVLFVSTSLEEGLLLPPNPLINLILESCLARAQTLHPVKICHHVFESNHAHFIMAVDNPEDVPAFMGRFKTESAHAINKILGRQKRTIWCEGYDSPPLLTVSQVKNEINYIYTNPAKDGLEDSIENYPGLSSWEAFKASEEATIECPRIRRPMVPDPGMMEEANPSQIAETLRSTIKAKQELKITPDAWMDCFNILDAAERQTINEEIQNRVAEDESRYKKDRMEQGRRAIGRARLIKARMNLDYRPEREGRRSICMSDDKEIRRAFIADVHAKKAEGKLVQAKWKVGDYSHPYPAGLFPPSLPRTMNLYSPDGNAFMAA